MQHHSHQEAIRLAYKGLQLLALVTVIEVIISLFAKGYLGWEEAYYIHWVHYVAGGIIAILSFYKAYFIVFNFMHLGMETGSMIKTVLLPLVLLIFAIIAFLWEGTSWNHNRSYILHQNELPSDRVVPHIAPTMEEEHVKNIHELIRLVLIFIEIVLNLP